MKKRICLRKIILSIILLFAINIIKAETIQVNDSITADTEWTADTVQITGNVTVAPGVTLTIAPGTNVIAQGYYYLNIYGGLTAVGTENEKIIFTVSDTTGFYDNSDNNGGWAGINFISDDLSEYSMIQYCDISFGKKVINTSTWDEVMEGGAMYIENNKNVLIAYNSIHHCKSVIGSAISMAGVDENCIITLNKLFNNKTTEWDGTILVTNQGGLILNNLIYNNYAYTGCAGIRAWQAAPKIVSNTIVNNVVENAPGGVGISLYNDGNDLLAEVFNNILWNNTDVLDNKNQLSINFFTGEANVYFNIIDEGIDNAGGVLADNILSEDPLFADAGNGDFRINKNSPAKDAGEDMGYAYFGDDILGNERIQGWSIDMGAVEYNFIEQPVKNLTGCTSEQTKINTKATGNGFFWIKDHFVLSGETDSVYIINNVAVADSGNYYCYYDSVGYEGKKYHFKLNVLSGGDVNLGEDMTKRISNSFELYPGENLNVTEWSTGATEDTLKIAAGDLTEGEHTLWAEAEDLCGNISSDTLIVTIVDEDYGYVDLTLEERDACESSSLILTGDKSGTSYSWKKDGDMMQGPASSDTLELELLDIADEGLYTCVVDTSELGGYYVNYNVTVYPLPEIDLEESYEVTKGVDEGASIDVGTATDTAQWSNGYVGNSFDILGHFSVAGEYNLSVEVTSSNGCNATDETVVTVLSPNSLADFNKDMEVNIQPNPSNGLFIYSCNQKITETGAMVEITDISGKTFEKKQITSEHTEFNLTNYPKGMYFVKTVVESKYNILKIIIK